MGTVFLRRRGCGQSPSGHHASPGRAWRPVAGRCHRTNRAWPDTGWWDSVGGRRLRERPARCPGRPKDRVPDRRRGSAPAGFRGDPATCARARAHVAAGPAARWIRPHFARAGTPRRQGPRRTARTVTARPVGGHRQTSAAQAGTSCGRCGCRVMAPATSRGVGGSLSAVAVPPRHRARTRVRRQPARSSTDHPVAGT